MNKPIGLQLIVYSLLLGGLSYLSHRLAPALAGPTLIVGLVGGGLCLVWSIRALLGSSGKALPILTLIPVNFVLLSQTVMGYSAGDESVPGRRGATVVVTLLLLLSIGMLMRIAYAGVVFDQPPNQSVKATPAPSSSEGRPGVQAQTGRRA